MSWIKKLLKPLLWAAIVILAIVAFYLGAVAIGTFAGALWDTGSLAAAWSSMLTALSVSWAATSVVLPVVGSVSIGLSLSTYVVIASVVLAIGGYLAPDVLTDIFTSIGLVEDESSGALMTSTSISMNSQSRPNVINFDEGVDNQRSILVDPNDGMTPAYRVTRVVGEVLDIASPAPRDEWDFSGWTTNLDAAPRPSSSIRVTEELTLVTGNWSFAGGEEPGPDPVTPQLVTIKFRVNGVVTHTRVVKAGDAVGLLPTYAGDLLHSDEFIDHWELATTPPVGVTEEWIPSNIGHEHYVDAVIATQKPVARASSAAFIAVGSAIAALLLAGSSESAAPQPVS